LAFACVWGFHCKCPFYQAGSWSIRLQKTWASYLITDVVVLTARTASRRYLAPVVSENVPDAIA
jgi:hypothetical protein